MRHSERIMSFISDDFTHIRDEFRRHASVSTISASALILISLPFAFVEGLVYISRGFLAASIAAFMFFSFLPDILRLVCTILNCRRINALSHSFLGAMFFSGLFVLALLPFNIWMPSLFAFCFLGYSLHLFIDSVEKIMDWCSHNLQKVFFSLPFITLQKNNEATTAR